LNDVVADICRLLPRLLGEDIEVVLGLDPDLKNVYADRGQIEQALMNLAVNARDAMPGGGRLTIETSTVQLDAQYSKQRALEVAAGEYVMLAMSDTGTGMSQEVQAQIFEPFFTTKDVGKGTGLGLSTVYGIVKQTGGYVFAESEVGKGTTFRVFLPRHVLDQEEEVARERPEKKKEAPKGPPLFLAMDPPFVVNFQSDQAVRFLQITVQVMTRDPKTQEELKVSDPIIRNDLLLLYGNQKYSDVATLEGKEKLRQDSLETVRKVIKDNGGEAGNVEAVYFTSFVMQ